MPFPAYFRFSLLQNTYLHLSNMSTLRERVKAPSSFRCKPYPLDTRLQLPGLAFVIENDERFERQDEREGGINHLEQSRQSAFSLNSIFRYHPIFFTRFYWFRRGRADCRYALLKLKLTPRCLGFDFASLGRRRRIVFGSTAYCTIERWMRVSSRLSSS